MRQNKTTNAGVYAKDSVKNSTIHSIEGLDVEKGILSSGGTFDLYLETLAVFYDDGTSVIEGLNKSIETGDLQLYKTYVHGLKRAAAFVGAFELSEAAYALELAGKQKDLEFIKKHNAGIIERLECLLTCIYDAIKKVVGIPLN